LLHLDHPQVALGLVVIKRDGEIEEEPQHGLLPLREAIEQVACWTLFGSPWFALVVLRFRGGSRRGIGLVAFPQDLLITTQHCCQCWQIQFLLS
jgi:hypothetical protein